MRRHDTLLLAGCATGLSCALLVGAAPPQPADAGPWLAQAAVEGPGTAPALVGTPAAGSKRNSPFAAAKEDDAETERDLQADRGRLWWLLLPAGLAALSYGVPRAQEGQDPG